MSPGLLKGNLQNYFMANEMLSKTSCLCHTLLPSYCELACCFQQRQCQNLGFKMKKNLIDSDTSSLNLYKPPIYIQSLEIGAHGISSLLNCFTYLAIRVHLQNYLVANEMLSKNSRLCHTLLPSYFELACCF